MMIEWLENYIKSLVSMPDEVSISRQEGVQVILLNLTVADDDLHLFEGRHNRLIRALNAVASLPGAKPRMRYVFKVSE